MTDSPRFPFDGDIDIEPDPRYARLRERCPVSRIQTPDGREAWLVVGHDDAKRALVDPRLTRSGTVDAQTVQAMGISGPPGRTALIYADPPELTRTRRIVSHYFDTAPVESLRPRAAAIVSACLDRMVTAGGPADLVTHLARPVPITIICELLGIDGADEADSDKLKHDVEVLLAIEDRGPTSCAMHTSTSATTSVRPLLVDAANPATTCSATSSAPPSPSSPSPTAKLTGLGRVS